jgi:hypothetical protein
MMKGSLEMSFVLFDVVFEFDILDVVSRRMDFGFHLQLSILLSIACLPFPFSRSSQRSSHTAIPLSPLFAQSSSTLYSALAKFPLSGIPPHRSD